MKRNTAVALIACAFSGAVFAQASSTALAPSSPNVTEPVPASVPAQTSTATAESGKHHRHKRHHHRRPHVTGAAPASAAS